MVDGLGDDEVRRGHLVRLDSAPRPLRQPIMRRPATVCVQQVGEQIVGSWHLHLLLYRVQGICLNNQIKLLPWGVLSSPRLNGRPCARLPR